MSVAGAEEELLKKLMEELSSTKQLNSPTVKRLKKEYRQEHKKLTEACF